MRETGNAQASIFDFYTEHEVGQQLKQLSELLNECRQIHTSIVKSIVSLPE